MDNAQEKNAIVTLRNVSEEKQRELERQAEEKAAKQALEEAYEAVSYTHLDVYKRQSLCCNYFAGIPPLFLCKFVRIF